MAIQRVGWRPYMTTQVVNAVDADATAFIAAAGITNLTQAAAINTLVNDLKAYGLWTKMKALYPMVGGNATSHKFNLKDPRDLDAAYRLIFSGGWNHTSTGVLPNGLNTFANSFIVPSTVFNTSTFEHLSYYSRTTTGSQGFSYDIGSYGSGSNGSLSMIIRRTTNASVFYSQFAGVSYEAASTTTTDGSGLFIGSQTGANIKLFKNNSLISSNTTISTNAQHSNYPVFIGTLGETAYATANRWSNKECAFASIGDGLTDTEAANFYNSIQKFQTTLGRHVGVPIVADTDAQAFINAAVITDATQANAVNTLVTDLKAAGVWTKMKAIYPFVGGTATTHKWNLKDPRDLNAAFRLVFNGGWVHSATGALPNGTTGYANTFFAPSSNFTSNENAHISVYQSQPMAVSDMGGSFNSTSRTLFGANTTLIDCRLNSNDNPVYVLSYNSDGKGLFITTKNGSSQVRAYRNDTLVGTITTQNSSNPLNMFISARNGNGTPNEYESTIQKFISFGDGLTDADATAFYTAVQKYQTSLGRQVGN